MCEPLGRQVLVSGGVRRRGRRGCRRVPLDHHTLRGVRELREIYGLELG
jgi:hypothetical protein